MTKQASRLLSCFVVLALTFFGNQRSVVAEPLPDCAQRMPAHSVEKLSNDHIMRLLSEDSDKTPTVKEFDRSGCDL